MEPSTLALITPVLSSTKNPVVLHHNGEVDGRVNCLAFSPDGQRIAVGLQGKTTLMKERVRIWDVITGRQLKTLKHQSEVRTVAFYPDGKRLITYGYKVRVWDIQTGQQLAEFTDARVDGWNRFAFSADGRWFAGTSTMSNFDRGWHIYDARNGQEVTALIQPGEDYAQETGVFSRDGQLFATTTSGGSNARVHVWDIQHRRLLSELPVPGVDDVNDFAFIPRENRIATSIGYTMKIWDAVSGRQLKSSKQKHHGDACFSADGRRFASRNSSEVILSDTDRGIELMRLGHDDPVYVNFSPDGGWIAVGSFDGEVQLWPMEAVNAKITQNLAVQAQLRQWTDATAAYSIPASCAAVDTEYVWLQRLDEKVVRVAISDLAEADQKHATLIRQLNEALQPVNGAETTGRCCRSFFSAYQHLHRPVETTGPEQKFNRGSVESGRVHHVAVKQFQTRERRCISSRVDVQRCRSMGNRQLTCTTRLTSATCRIDLNWSCIPRMENRLRR